MSYSKFLESKSLKVWCKGNELRITPPEKITPDIMAKLKGDTTTPAIWHNPYPQGTIEARQESLLQCMGAICLKTREAIEEAYRGEHRQYEATPVILAAEERLVVLQRSVLKGEAKLKDFQEAADRWQRTAKAELN